jgi:hypothetical protein
MSFVIASPDVLASASSDLAGIGSAIKEATSAAAPSTTSVVAAAEDEVSAAVAKLFGSYGQEFQAIATASQQLTGIGSSISEATSAAAPSTTTGAL